MTKFIKMASQLLYPLQQAIKVEPLQWNEDCEVVFNQVKEVLGEIAHVKAPDFS